MVVYGCYFYIGPPFSVDFVNHDIHGVVGDGASANTFVSSTPYTTSAGDKDLPYDDIWCTSFYHVHYWTYGE